jgi:hypothetical protein
MTVCGTIAGDSFGTSALGEVFVSAAVAGTNNSILLPPGLAMNDNVLHLMFSTSNGQPIIQASWAAFNSNYGGTINLPANTNPSP